MSMKIIFVLFGVVILAITAARAADNDHPRPLTIISHTFSQFSYQDPATRIIIGKVTQVLPPLEKQDTFPINLTYDVLVMAEYEGRISEGSSIIVRGRIEGNQTASGVEFISMKVGDIFLMAVSATSDKNQFDNLGHADLPIGVGIPRIIDAKDIAEVKAGLLAFGKIMKTPTKMIGPEEAQTLIDGAKGNFYIWALGVSGLSLNGTAKEAQRIGEMYGENGIKVFQVLWMDTCLERLFPKETRPSYAQRHDFLITYLVRQTDFVPP